MPISRAGAALALAGLAGCAGYESVSDDRVRVTVAGKQVFVEAPDGFCFDRRNTDITRTGAVMLAAACSLTGTEPGAIPPPAVQGFIKVFVAREGAPDGMDNLEQFFRTPAGTATLGKSGAPKDVTLLGMRRLDDVLFAKVRDRGEPEAPGISSVFWRAFFETSDRLVGLSLISFAGANPSDREAIGYLSEFANRTRALNPETAAEQPVVTEAPETPKPGGTDGPSDDKTPN